MRMQAADPGGVALHPVLLEGPGAGLQALPPPLARADVIDADWALSPKMQKMTRRSGEPWLFALPAGEERAWIEGQGLAVLDELRYEELLARYMPDDARGRTLGACGDFGCFPWRAFPDVRRCYGDGSVAPTRRPPGSRRGP